jgi:hypothetical protein
MYSLGELEPKVPHLWLFTLSDMLNVSSAEKTTLRPVFCFHGRQFRRPKVRLCIAFHTVL